MTTTAIRLKLYDYISTAEEKKIKAIYKMLENEIEETYDHWNDKEFTAEITRRSEDYKTGKVKGVAWEDVKSRILTSNRKSKK